MRKIILATIALSMFVFSANAQIKKGSIFLGGDISGFSQKTKSGDVNTYKQSGIHISPVIGKAIKDNLILGANVGFGISKSIDPVNDLKFNSSSFNAGIFLRKYRNIGTGGFYVFVQSGLNGNYNVQKQKSPSAYFNEIKQYSIGLNANPGFSYALNNKLHLETGFNNLFSIYYSNDQRKSGSPVVTTHKTNGFGISSSLSNATSNLYLGFRLLLSK